MKACQLFFIPFNSHTWYSSYIAYNIFLCRLSINLSLFLRYARQNSDTYKNIIFVFRKPLARYSKMHCLRETVIIFLKIYTMIMKFWNKTRFLSMIVKISQFLWTSYRYHKETWKNFSSQVFIILLCREKNRNNFLFRFQENKLPEWPLYFCQYCNQPRKYFFP